MDELSYENIQDIYELTPLQMGMYYHYLRDKSESRYITQMSYRIEGKFDIEFAEKSLNKLIQQHDILRTVFNHESTDQILQIVLRERKEKINFIDLADDSMQEEYVEQFKRKDRNTAFDLNKDILIRVAILKIRDDLFEFVWTHHHILMDGWCISKLINDFNEIYAAYLKGETQPRKECTQFKEYIKWLAKQDHVKAGGFWREYLADYNESVTIPWTNTKKASTYHKKEKVYQISYEINMKLDRLIKDAGVTLNSIIQCSWGLFLALYRQKKDVVFGMIVSGRNPEVIDVENIMGLFINNLPIRIRFGEDTTFIDLLHKVNDDIASINEYAYTSISEIQTEIGYKSNLIDHIIVFENYPIEDKTDAIFGDVAADKNYHVISTDSSEETNYDFNLVVQPDHNHLSFRVMYNGDSYQESTIDQIMEHYEHILMQFIEHKDMCIEKAELLTENEKDLILHQFNDTNVKIIDNIPIIHRFEQQVRNMPNAVAVMTDTQEVTYQQLNQLTNQVAKALIKQGIKKHDVVGLLACRSIEMMICIYAIQKIGAVYLPIIPEYPVDRIKYMLDDSDAEVLLCFTNYMDIAEKVNSRTLVYENLEIEKESIDNINQQIELEDTMYIIYTSGSSGKPKGVMIEQQSVINRLNWMQKKYPITTEDRIIQKTPITFDVSIWELFWWSFTGASLYMLSPNAEKDPKKIFKCICQYNITTMHFVPSMFQAFMQYLSNCDQHNEWKLRRVFTSGEALTSKQVHLFNQLFYMDEVELVNLYGPTEATVDVTYYDCKKNEEIDLVPIGKPIDNIKIYILGHNNHLMPVGIPGELVISGIGVARGYIKRPELTNEKFVDDLFVPDHKMYKTGDLAKWLPDGNIEYLGRNDNQVKIHGIRIELNEIENNLNEIEEIDDVVVIIKEYANDRELVAFVMIHKEIEVEEIKEKLRVNLPEYMIPAKYIFVDRIPLTANGKKDRKYFESYDLSKEFETYNDATLDDVERMFVEIWADVLGIQPENINRDTNIFEIGGNSINIIYFISKANRKADIELNIAGVFKYPTIHMLSDFVKQTDQSFLTNDNSLDESQLLENSFNFFMGDEDNCE